MWPNQLLLATTPSSLPAWTHPNTCSAAFSKKNEISHVKKATNFLDNFSMFLYRYNKHIPHSSRTTPESQRTDTNQVVISYYIQLLMLYKQRHRKSLQLNWRRGPTSPYFSSYKMTWKNPTWLSTFFTRRYNMIAASFDTKICSTKNQKGHTMRKTPTITLTSKSNKK